MNAASAALLVVSTALAHPAEAQSSWRTIEVPGTPSGMLQYDSASVMRTRSGGVVSVWERINKSGEGTGGWKLARGKRYKYAYQVTHWTFGCVRHMASLGAIGYFDSAGRLIEASPSITSDGLEPNYLPVSPGTWEAATMVAVCNAIANLATSPLASVVGGVRVSPTNPSGGLNTWVLTVGSALLGALLAFLVRGLYDRWGNAATARGLAVALWEELSATEFKEQGTFPLFGGFSSQVFDTLFSALAGCLPEGLFREVVRYHWKMKFIQEHVRRSSDAGTGAIAWGTGGIAWVEVQDHVKAAQAQWKGLLPRLDRYAKRSRPRLFLTRREHLLPGRG